MPDKEVQRRNGGTSAALAQARDREAATREILSVISRSRDDEKPVFHAILENAARLCSVKNAGLMLVKPGGVLFHQAAAWGKWVAPVNSAMTWPVDGPLPLAVAIREVRTVHIEDMTAAEAYRAGDPTYVKLVEEEGLRTRLCVPLVHDGTAFGAISLSRHEVRPFEPDEIALIETFAAQAVIAIENVRQFRELQMRLEREAATREILQVISQSRDDKRPVFDAILRNAARLCGSPMARLELADDTRTTFQCVAAWGEEMRSFRLNEAMPLDHPNDLPTAIREGEIRHIHDLSKSELYLQGDPTRVRMVEEEEYRTYLVVPLLAGAVGIGAIVLCRREVAPFADADIALVESFAATAVIAIENVRQFCELQTRLDREAATRKILQVISQSRDDEKPVFDAILENATRLCSAPLAYLSMANEDRTRVSVPAHRGARPKFAADLDSLLVAVDGSGLAMVRSITECEVIRMDDLADTELYRSGEPNRVAMVENEGARSILAVPLISSGQGVGAIILYRREVAPFSDDDVALMQNFAAQAVIAVQNVKQFKALQARTEEVQALNANLEGRVATQVGELERLGRLRRFLSPQVADAVVSAGDDKLLTSHRALIATLFCDIRGFTAFCETAEPEETIEVLQTYHEEMGKLINAHGAGVDHRIGDGIMVIFNDPLPCDDPAGSAVGLALDMRARMADLCKGWRRLGHRLGFGVGISLGYATVGMVGSEGRYEYTASGTAVNLAARLCDKAADGEILLSPRAYMAVQDDFEAQSGGELDLKGIQAPTEVFRVSGRKAAQTE